MKVTVEPPIEPTVHMEMAMSDAQILRKIASHNMSVPRVFSNEGTPYYEEIKRFLDCMRIELTNAGVD